jgi:hypothetical protein
MERGDGDAKVFGDSFPSVPGDAMNLLGSGAELVWGIGGSDHFTSSLSGGYRFFPSRMSRIIEGVVVE